jgi:hypothetical protein
VRPGTSRPARHRLRGSLFARCSVGQPRTSRPTVRYTADVVRGVGPQSAVL